MNISGGYGITADKAMVNTDADAVLIAVVADPILFDPACLQVFLLQSIWVFVSAIGIEFMTPSPTNSTKDCHSFTWNSTSSTARGRLRLSKR